MSESNLPKSPFISAARRIRDFEVPFVSSEARADHLAFVGHRDPGLRYTSVADGCATVEVL
jgi:hypothetical protein